MLIYLSHPLLLSPLSSLLSHRVLASYAATDWKGIAAHLPLTNKAMTSTSSLSSSLSKSVLSPSSPSVVSPVADRDGDGDRHGGIIVDLGGGTGSLLREIERGLGQGLGQGQGQGLGQGRGQIQGQGLGQIQRQGLGRGRGRGRGRGQGQGEGFGKTQGLEQNSTAANRLTTSVRWVTWGGVDYGSTLDYGRVADALLPVKDSTSSQTTAQTRVKETGPRLICVERPEVVRAVALATVATASNHRNEMVQDKVKDKDTLNYKDQDKSLPSKKPGTSDAVQGKAVEGSTNATSGGTGTDRPSRVEFQEVCISPSYAPPVTHSTRHISFPSYLLVHTDLHSRIYFLFLHPVYLPLFPPFYMPFFIIRCVYIYT